MTVCPQNQAAAFYRPALE